MPRKSAASLEEARSEIKRQYKRGPRRERKISAESALTHFEREVKREVACYLKASDFSYNYIGDALGVSRDVVKKWFIEPEMQAKTAKISKDFVDGAIKLMKSYAIEIIEIFMEIVRTSSDDKVILQAGTELLDRMGLTKVNKSESAASITRRDEVDITDKTGILERAQGAPAHVQRQMAEHMESLLALATEHAEEVTNA